MTLKYLMNCLKHSQTQTKMGATSRSTGQFLKFVKQKHKALEEYLDKLRTKGTFTKRDVAKLEELWDDLKDQYKRMYIKYEALTTSDGKLLSMMMRQRSAHKTTMTLRP